MSRKFSIIVIALSAVTALLAIILANALKSDEIFIPENVTVYIKEKGSVEKIAFEEFVKGCVYGRIPKNGELYESEALSAVATVQRTMALYSLEQGKSAMGADFSVNEDFPYISAADSAITHPNREIIGKAVENSGFLVSENSPANVTMCDISAGITDPSENSPALDLPCDALAKGYLSSTAFTPKETRLLLGVSDNPPIKPKVWFDNALYNPSGTLQSIDFLGRTLTGEELRSALNLRSTAISVEYKEDKFFFSCKGLGNNRGMSINAADSMAKQGKSAEEIVALFYPNLKCLNFGKQFMPPQLSQ